MFASSLKDFYFAMPSAFGLDSKEHRAIQPPEIALAPALACCVEDFVREIRGVGKLLLVCSIELEILAACL